MIKKTECKYYRCLQIPSTFNELLYTMKSDRYYYPQSNNAIIGNNYKLHSLSYGLNYSFYLQQNESIRLFPLYFGNFNYLTYHLKSEHINNVSIFNCDNYPLCTLSPNDNSKNTPIQRAYGSYSFSFNKNEIPNWSPIGKNQKLLMITCYNSTLRQKYCENLVRIYTDKSSLFLKTSRNNEYMIIRKGNINKLRIYDLTYVSIETLTGKISIDFDNNTTNHYSKGNINTFIIKKDSAQNKIILFLTIKCEKDSVYSIKNHKETITKTKNIGTINDINFSYGGNSLFKLQQNEIVKSFILSFQSNHFSALYIREIGRSLGSIKNASTLYNNYTLTPVKYNWDEGIYSEIFNNSDRKIWIEPGKDTCFIFVSFSLLDNSVYDSGIVLENNSFHSLTFNDRYVNEYREFKYLYYFLEIENKIKINFNYHCFSNDYTIIIFINDNIIKEIKYAREEIELKKNIWENICENSQQICKLTILAKIKYYEMEKLTVLISSEEEKEEEEENIPEKKNNTEEKNNTKEENKTKEENNPDRKSNSKEENNSKKDNNTNLIVFLIIFFSIIVLMMFFICLLVRCKNNNNIKNEIENLSKENEIKLV